MSYVGSSLLPDERVVYVAHLHWIIYLRGLFVTICGGLFGYYAAPLVTYFLGSDIGQHFIRPFSIIAIAVVAFGAFLIFISYLQQSSTEIVITNRRIIAKYGFISRSTFEVLISRITGVNFDQTVTGRLLGFGTILVRGAGADIAPVDNVSSPQGFHNALMSVMERAQRGMAV